MQFNGWTVLFIFLSSLASAFLIGVWAHLLVDFFAIGWEAISSIE
jgi:hypothetical protein